MEKTAIWLLIATNAYLIYRLYQLQEQVMSAKMEALIDKAMPVVDKVEKLVNDGEQIVNDIKRFL